MEFQPRRYQASKLIVGVIRKKHPWIHRKALSSAIDAIPPASLVRIVDGENRFAANAIYEPLSSIAMRLLPSDDPITPGTLCEKVLNLCNDKKGFGEAFRLINGEGDLLPGLTCDIYRATAVWQPYLSFWDPLVPIFAQAVSQRLGIVSHIVKPPTQRHSETTVLSGPPVQEPIPFIENGMTFHAYPLTGQKSGFYLDLREAREMLPEIVPGRSFLNCFASGGAFTLIARRYGAADMLSIDIDKDARVQAENLMRANGYALPDGEWLTANLFDTLANLAARDRKFGLVIVDPPNMCTNKNALPSALKGWQKLLRAAKGALAPGGLLLAINCSSFMTRDLCAQAVAELELRSVKTGGLPKDHTIRREFPEGNYLKWWLYAEK